MKQPGLDDHISAEVRNVHKALGVDINPSALEEYRSLKRTDIASQDGTGETRMKYRALNAYNLVRSYARFKHRGKTPDVNAITATKISQLRELIRLGGEVMEERLLRSDVMRYGSQHFNPPRMYGAIKTLGSGLVDVLFKRASMETHDYIRDKLWERAARDPIIGPTMLATPVMVQEAYLLGQLEAAEQQSKMIPPVLSCVLRRAMIEFALLSPTPEDTGTNRRDWLNRIQRAMVNSLMTLLGMHLPGLLLH